MDASYHSYFYQNQQIIRYPCKTKAFCPFFHFIKHISFSCTTLPVLLVYSRKGPSFSYKFGGNLILQKRALRLIPFKPFRFHIVPLFKLSNVLPLNFLYFKTICLVMHGVSNNVTPLNVSKLFTYSILPILFYSFLFYFYIKYSRTERMKNSFSRTGAKIRNSIPDSDRALPK